MYLVSTRSDIAYIVHILSQFMTRPTHFHYGHLLRVLRYLHETLSSFVFS